MTNYSFLKAYRSFSSALNDEEKGFLQKICSKIEQRNQLNDICSPHLFKEIGEDRYKRLNLFMDIIHQCGHKKNFLYISKLVLASDQKEVWKRASKIEGYNVPNKGYIQIKNFHKYDRSFLGRLDSIREYVIKKIEDSNEV